MEISEFQIFLVGCGSIGKRHAECLYELGIRRFLFYDTDVSQSQALAKAYGGEAVESYEAGLLSGCDAVYILSPTRLHVEQARAALEKNKHVFMEKPLSTSLDGVEELEILAKQRGLTVTVGFCFRFHDGIRKMYRWYQEGAIGKLVSIRAMMGEHFPDVRPDYRNTYYVKYSGAFELIHDLDLALYFAGEMPVEYGGYFGSYSGLGFESPDCVELNLRFGDKLANVHLDFFQSPRTRTFTLLGTEGQLVLDFADWNRCALRLFTRESGQWAEERMDTRRNDMFTAESKAFLEAALGRGENPVPISEAKKSLEIYQRVYSDRVG